MRIFEFICESTGLANRKPGEVWKDPQGNELQFKSLTFYPTSGSFLSVEERDGKLQKLGLENVKWVNDGNKKNLLGFAVSAFSDQNNNVRYFGKYFEKISPNATENYFPNTLPGDYKLQLRAAVKEATPYKPSQIFTKFDNLTISDIKADVINKFGKGSDEDVALQTFINSDFPIKIPRGNINTDAFNNYFAEILQPLSLVLRKKVSGNALEAESIFLTDGGFDQCLISFGEGPNANLFDSKLTNSSGQSIIISSKAQGANKSSARGLKEKFDEAANSDEGKKIIAKYQDTVDVLNTIVNDGYINAPLNLAEKYKIIEADDIEIVKKLKGLPPGSVNLNPTLQALYDEKKSADASRIIPFYHMLTAIAYKVAEHVNDNTDFSGAAAKILNHSGYMKMTSSISVSTDHITINSFTATYPGDSVQKIKLDATKNYYSTGNKGGFAFSILKGRGKIITA